MKTIQMTIDENLLVEVDTMIASLDMTRSAFMREAIKHALQRNRIKQLEQQEAEAYARLPMNLSEVLEWQTEQIWGDEWVSDQGDKKV
jgi:metal-responsive CopG/Arc/MetJ family transcriptional regulator